MIKYLQQKLLVVHTNSWLDVLANLLIIICMTVILVILFIYSFLINITHHNQTITVPDLRGMNVDEAERFLHSRGLDYVIGDSTHSRKHKPFVVLSQSPEAGDKVKLSRRIVLTVNPKVPPKSKVPSLFDTEYDDAKRRIESSDLEIGRIRYKPDVAQDKVLEYYIDGKKMDRKLAFLDNN